MGCINSRVKMLPFVAVKPLCDGLLDLAELLTIMSHSFK